MTLFSFVLALIHILLIIVPVLLSVAFMTLGERKALGYMQARKGPTLVGPYGLLQPMADGVKLFMKEPSKPFSATSMIFFIAPILALTIALILWIPMTFPSQFSSLNLSLIFILTLSSLAVYPILGSGWASNSKYSLMGAIRAVAQTISYEVSLGLTVLCITVLVGNFNLTHMMETQNFSWFLMTVLPMAIVWYISTLAETSRTPFDLAEGESELVSGFNVEYAGGPFALFFLAEYSNMMFMNTLSVTLLLGGGSPLQFFGWPQMLLIAMKMTFFSFLFLWIRGSYPRFRYDQLMHLAWKTYLPLTLGFVAFFSALPMALNFLPTY